MVRDEDWNLAYEVTDGARWVVRIPGLPGIGFSLAIFTDSPEVGGFRSLTGETLDIPSVKLAETGFSPQGGPFWGETTAGVPGGGKWGGRWSDGEGRAVRGTFGFTATDGSVAILGAFNACSCPSADGGTPDGPVAAPQ